MLISQLQENIKPLLNQENMILLDHQALVKILLDIKNIDLFLFSYLRDTINLYAKIIGNTRDNNELNNKTTRIGRLLNALTTRLTYFHHWDGDNTTIAMIKNKDIPFNKIKPFIRKSNEEYENYYAAQNETIKQRLNEKINDSTQPNIDLQNVPIVLKKSLAHSYRKTYVVHLIEFLMGLLDTSESDINNKTWLDIGCSIGLISNAVDSSLYAKSKWKIIGCDLQENRIKYAQHLSASNRNYFAKDAFRLISQMQDDNKSIDIVSMFEFCEHFEDPVKLIQKAANLDIKVIVIATPLAQKLNAPFNDEQDNVHLWGFTRESMEAIVKSTDMQIFSITENRIGTYHHGFDWLTTVMVRSDILDKINTIFNKK